LSTHLNPLFHLTFAPVLLVSLVDLVHKLWEVVALSGPSVAAFRDNLFTILYVINLSNLSCLDLAYSEMCLLFQVISPYHNIQ